MADPYVTVAELRDIPALTNEDKFPDSMLAGYVEEFEWKCEAYIGVALVTRERTWFHRSDDCRSRVYLPDQFVQDITAATIGGNAVTDLTTIDTSDLAGGFITLPSIGDLAITYNYGLDELPALARNACLFYVRFSAMYEASVAAQDGREPIYVSDGAGGSTRYVRQDAANRAPTCFDKVNDRLNTLRDKLYMPVFA